jgi:hypothetical protein
VHIDTKRFQRFTRPGHAKTGDRRRSGDEKRMRIGHEFVHSIVDDHTRLAYSERHPDERAATVTAFFERALAYFAGLGIEAKRLMSDNAFVYTRNRSLRELLERSGIRHLVIEAYRPQNQRQGRALPADPQARVGARPGLPILRASGSSPETLGRALQPNKAPLGVG